MVRVPGGPAPRIISARPAQRPPQPAEAESPPAEDEELEEERPRQKKRKKAKTGSGLSTPSFEVFGLSPLKLLLVLVAVALLGMGIYALVPTDRPKVLDVRRVDVFSALEVVHKKAPGKIPGIAIEIMKADARRHAREQGLSIPDEPDPISLGDGGHFLIARDSPEGDSLLLRVALSPKFLTKRVDMRDGNLNVRSNEFKLRREGAEVEGLLINTSLNLPDRTAGAKVEFFDLPTDTKFSPRDRVPWTHPGRFYLDDLQKEKVEDDKGRVHLSYTGPARFEGRSGMKVNYEYDGSIVKVTWDRDSTAYIGGRDLDFYSGSVTFSSLELTCLFPRPPGQSALLVIMGQEVYNIKLP
jgi:hypothetical protein